MYRERRERERRSDRAIERRQPAIARVGRTILSAGSAVFVSKSADFKNTRSACEAALGVRSDSDETVTPRSKLPKIQTEHNHLTKRSILNTRNKKTCKLRFMLFYSVASRS